MTFKEYLDILKDDLHDIGFSFVKNEMMLSDSWKKNCADIVIYSENENRGNIAVILCTSKSTDHPIDLTYAKKVANRMVMDYDFGYGVVWHEGKVHIFDPSEAATKQWKVTHPDEHSLQDLLIQYNWSRIPNTFIQELLKAVKETSAISKWERKTRKVLIEWFETITQDNLDTSNRSVYPAIEDELKLLYSLFDAFEFKKNYKLCRYTSLAGLKRILLDDEESLCGLAAMNDKSEGLFLDKCLLNSSYNVYRHSQSYIDRYNSAFISSLCDESMADNLTMWRLYGGDGTGCCLIYEADKETLYKSPDFNLIPVTYGTSSNPIYLLFRLLGKISYINGFHFTLKHKYIWKYFVKPDDFSIEKELRLLHLSVAKSAAVKWILNSTYSIFHPIEVFKSPLVESKSAFPLKLKKVILGPKCSEALVNKVQLRSLLNRKSIVLEISNSRIDFYR